MTRLTILLFIIALFIGCQKDDSPEELQEELNRRKQSILGLIASATCNDSGCAYIGFGAKPCGGPLDYLLYPISMDTVELQTMVMDYNRLNRELNQKKGSISDCAFLSPPDTVYCMESSCVDQI